MTYGNVPFIILLLAAGYLLTIYLLLTLAKRSTKETQSTRDVGQTSSVP